MARKDYRKGWFGVHVFFTLSGFILALPFARHHFAGGARPDTRRFYLRRVTRIVPPYVLNMLFLFAIVPLFSGITRKSLLPHLGTSLLYAHNLVYADYSGVNGVTWTLEVEIQFYILAPLLAHLFRLRPAWFRRLAMLAGIAGPPLLVGELASSVDQIRMSIVNYVQYFLAGLLLADFYVTDWGGRPGRNWRWDVLTPAGVLLSLCLLFWAGKESIWLPFAIIVGLIGVLRGTISGFLLGRPAVATLGAMSYTIYLYHAPFIFGLRRATMRLDQPHWPVWFGFGIQVAVIGVPLLIVSAGFFVLFERPFMDKDWPVRLGRFLRSRPWVSAGGPRSRGRAGRDRSGGGEDGGMGT